MNCIIIYRYIRSKMVTKTEICAYTEYKIYPGRGRKFIAKDGRHHYFFCNKARQLYHQKIKNVKLTWTQAWRRFNKKIRVDDIQKRRTKKTTRVQKAVVGMSLDTIKRMKAETREERDKKLDTQAKEVKDRQLKKIQQKKTDKSKQAKVAPAQKAAKAAPVVKKSTNKRK